MAASDDGDAAADDPADRQPGPQPNRHPTTGRRGVAAWNLAAVAIGGSIGTALRFALTGLLASALRWPGVSGPSSGNLVAIWLINISGAFALGLLLEGLLRSSRFQGGIVPGLGQTIRLGVGTGVLGGFTTYSTLSVDVVTVARSAPLAAAGYALGTLIAGLIAAAAGIAMARRLLPRPAR